MNRISVHALLTALPLLASGQAVTPPSAAEIMAKFEAADLARRNAMPGYTSMREYTVENKRFHVKAGMKVEVTVDPSGAKHFRTISVNGPGAVRKLVFKRMLDTETRAAATANQPATRICRDNYTFKFIETALVDGRNLYVLEAEPKSANPLLFKGRIWIDAGHLAVIRIEGEPAKNPSFWVRKTSFVHQNSLVEGHWVPALNTSESSIRFFGDSTTRIVYGGYSFKTPTPAAPEP